MSRTSSELSAFTRAFWAATAVLAVIAAVFLTLGALQGPKLSTAQLDATRATEQPGQQLRLFANQPLDDLTPEQVSVEPDARVSVAVDGPLITVQFDEPLRYATDYTVTVRGVGSPSRDATSDFVHTFTTGPARFVYIDRSPAGDEVLRADVAGTGRGDVVHAADGIQFAAEVENVLVVARDGEAGGSVLEVVDGSSDAVERVTLPSPTLRVDALIAPPVGTTVALLLSEPSGDEGALNRALALVDLAGAGVAELVTGIDGEPLSALSAHFLPAGDALLVHDDELALVRLPLADPSLGLPIGQFSTVHGVSADGTRVAATDPFGGVVLDLESGEEERVNPSLFDGELVFGADFALAPDGAWVQRVALTDASGAAVASLIVADDGTGESRLLARTVDDAGSFGDLTLSPNGQFVAIEVVPQLEGAVADGRAVNPQTESVTVVIVDRLSGQLVRSVAGFQPRW